MDRKRRKLTLEKVIAELEQLKEELGRPEPESECDKYKEQSTELQSEKEQLQTENEKLQTENEKFQSENEKFQSENEKLQSENEKLQSENKRLQKYLQDLESASVNVGEKRPINLCHSDVTDQITKVNESNDDALGINSLPDEIIIQVFGYLKQNQLGQIARVCRRWSVLTRSPVLWKKVNVKFSPSHRCQTTVAEFFINRLPSCVTSIRLNFMEKRRLIGTLNFSELCVKLQEKCPHLEELMLTDSVLSNNLPEVLNLCSQFLQDIKNLIFHHSRFRCDRPTVERSGISKIEILRLLYCDFRCSSKSPFSKMPHLKQLHLFGTKVEDSWFKDDISFLNQLHVLNVGNTGITRNTIQSIKNHGINLKEFYICESFFYPHLTFTDSAFPYLKTICLRGFDTRVTCEDVVSLIQSHPSLENVYVDEHVAESFTAHPFVVANRCKSGIVKAIDWNHRHNVDYSHT